MVNKVSINLLPQEVKQKRESERYLVIIGVVAAVWIVVLAMFTLYLRVGVSAERTNLENLKTKNSVLEAQISKYKEFEIKKQRLSDLKEVYNNLNNRELSWYKMLVELALIAPEEISLNSFNINRSTVQIQGVCSNVMDVAAWIIRLEELPEFKNVWLENVSISKNEAKFTVNGEVAIGGST